MSILSWTKCRDMKKGVLAYTYSKIDDFHVSHAGAIWANIEYLPGRVAKVGVPPWATITIDGEAPVTGLGGRGPPTSI